MTSNPETSGKTALRDATGSQTFRPVTAVVIWWVWVVFAAGNLIDLVVQGRDHLSAVAAAILLLLTGVAYVTAERPRVIAAAVGITVRNPLRDHIIPWPQVSNVELADQLRVHCRQPQSSSKPEKVINVWAVHYSRRRQMASDLRTRRATTGTRARGSAGLGYAARPASAAAATSPEAEAVRIARLLNDRAADRLEAAAGTEAAAGAEAGAPEGEVGTPASIVSTWSRPALTALAVPALVLLVVALA